jgi:hypothetical protein
MATEQRFAPNSQATVGSTVALVLPSGAPTSVAGAITSLNAITSQMLVTNPGTVLAFFPAASLAASRDCRDVNVARWGRES